MLAVLAVMLVVVVFVNTGECGVLPGNAGDPDEGETAPPLGCCSGGRLPFVLVLEALVLFGCEEGKWG